MFIQIQTDNQIDSGADANERLEERVRERLARFNGRLTRVEVHVSDVDGPKGGGNDKRASLEVRPGGLDPIAVTHDARRIEDAVNGATDKAVRALDRMFGKLSSRKGH